MGGMVAIAVSGTATFMELIPKGLGEDG